MWRVVGAAVTVPVMLFASAGPAFGALPAGRSTVTAVAVNGQAAWSDTGIDVPAGATAAIEATGLVHIAGSDPGKPPSGDPRCTASPAFVLPGAVCWVLIARVGNGTASAVGASGTVTAGTGGRLYLGVNDEQFADNAGAWTATVDVRAGSQTPPATGRTLYSADWSRGLGGWAGGGDWKTLNGMLLNDGTDDHGGCCGHSFVPIVAPFEPDPINDYAVEAEIRVVQEGIGFGLLARRVAGTNGGYAAGVGGGTGIARADGWTNGFGGRQFDPKRDWHTYRLEVAGNVTTFRIDGAEFATLTDNRYLDGGTVGIWCNSYQLEIRRFNVLRLG